MTRQEELNEAWCEYRGMCSTEIVQALAFALKWADAHPHWTSVEDELPRCNIPYTNWDGSPSDVMESERVVALIDNVEVCIATLNQNIDEDTKKPAVEPYWFAEGETEDGGWIAGRVTHWMPMPQAQVLSNVEKTGKNQKERR